MLERPKLKVLKPFFLFSFGQFWLQPKDFCCDLRCGHGSGLDVATCSFLSLVILVVTSNLLLRLSFLLYCFNVQHSWLQLMNCCCDQKNFQVSLNNQIHNNFNLFKFNQNKYNSIHLHHLNIQQIHSLCIRFTI